MQGFNDIEALKIAIEIEKRGAAIYSRALRIARNERVKATMKELYDEEMQHAAVFEQMCAMAMEQADEACDYPPEASLFLSAFAAEIAFPGGLMKLATDNGLDDPRVVLEQAVQAEKNSILFYQEIIAVSQSDALKKYLGDVIREERSHLMGLLTQLRDLG